MADIELDARIVAAAQAHLAEAARQIAWVPPLSAAGCGSPDVTQAVADGGAWLRTEADGIAQRARELAASLRRIEDAWRAADAALAADSGVAR